MNLPRDVCRPLIAEPHPTLTYFGFFTGTGLLLLVLVALMSVARVIQW